ncbi:MAG: hypothetical protein ABI321_18025 [Polyangia bacterium]
MRVATSILSFTLLITTAWAADLPCPPVESGNIALDGLADDWRDAQAVSGGDAEAGVTLRCDVEGKTLYLEVEATDKRVIRTSAAHAGEDHLELKVGKKTFKVFPSSGTVRGKVTPSARMASSSSDTGFVVELSMPLKSIGLGAHPDRIPYSLTFADCDSAAALKTEHTAVVEGELAFSSGPSTLDSFLTERSLSRSVVRWTRSTRDHGRSVDFVQAGKYLAALTDGYTFVELPVSDGTDVKDPRLVDLAGDGRPAVLLRYIERDGEGSREILAAYRLSGATLQRVFAAEVGKHTPGGTLVTKVTLRSHGRGTDLVLEAQAAQGLSTATYSEAPATDVEPILLPWTAAKRAVYTFSGDGFQKK